MMHERDTKQIENCQESKIYRDRLMRIVIFVYIHLYSRKLIDVILRKILPKHATLQYVLMLAIYFAFLFRDIQRVYHHYHCTVILLLFPILFLIHIFTSFGKSNDITIIIIVTLVYSSIFFNELYYFIYFSISVRKLFLELPTDHYHQLLSNLI